MRVPLISVLISAGVGWSCAGAIRPTAPIPTPAGVRFEVMNPGARSVALAGSFNDWSASATPLSQDGTRGLWTVLVTLPPGEHAFMYVVDGTRWMTPPLAEYYAEDGFGAKNGVVVVK